MESPLEVLSRAATMVQDNSGDTRHASKELPTTKWRRDRRIRMSTEYHTSPPSPGVKPLAESNAGAGVAIIESPLDMSVSATKPPPPPYREPLPGSQFAVHHHAHVVRASVITQAPKREANQENSRVAAAVESISMIDPVIDEHFRRSLGADYAVLFGSKKPGAAVKPTPIVGPKKTNHNNHPTVSPSPTTSTIGTVSPSSSSSSSPIASVSPMVSPTSTLSVVQAAAIITPTSRISTAPSTSAAIVVKVEPQPARQPQPTPPTRRPSSSASSTPAADVLTEDTEVGMSVDDHFAKALGGDTWKQLNLKRSESRNDDAMC